MSCTEQIVPMLRQRGFRMTSQRRAVLQAMHPGGHLSPRQVYQRVRSAGLTEATVYRTLDFLVRNGILRAADRGSGHLAYELTHQPHHHLVCRGCGSEMEMDPALLFPAVNRVENKTGYHLEMDHLTLYGTCPACLGRQAKDF